MIQRLFQVITALVLKVVTFKIAVSMAIIFTLHRGVALQLINVFVKSPYHRVQRLVDSFQTLTAANVDSTRAPQPLVVTVLEVPASATRNLASMRLRMYILSHLANVAMQEIHQMIQITV